MQTGGWFNRQNVHDNMYDFVRVLNSKELINMTREDVYQAVLDATTTHFEENDKALTIPMVWSVVEKYLESCRNSNLIFIRTAKEVWFEKLKK